MPRARRGLQAVAAPSAKTLTRAAIYTRKSTDEGLDRDFSSLDNQRERAEAYIASQGWVPAPDRYDDGGFSGGTMERPALKRLLADADAGIIDTIVCYRLDRISRSLVQFGRIHEHLNKGGVSLVSVTESINTNTPHGRMMVNVLLSFAQYERELAAERTRHKISAARRRGKWTGGCPPLGLDVTPEGGKLIANKDEADQVKATFQLFADNPSLIAISQELNRRGWRQKTWTTKNGKVRHGGKWNKESLRTLLSNPLYIGNQRLGDETFKGEHKAIVPKALFEEVQRRLKENRSNGGASARNSHGFLLRGLVRCSACDSAMVSSTTKRGGRTYRYYRCSSSEKRGAATCPTKSVPADQIEQFVIDRVRRIGSDVELRDETFRQAVAQVRAVRRGLKAERKRLQRDLVATRSDVERLVGAVSRATGGAADAIAMELEKTQQRLATLKNRQQEIESELADLDAQVVDREHLTRALAEFDPIWDVLLTPERERVLKLLIERVDYDGTTKELTIDWRLAGFGELAAEVGA